MGEITNKMIEMLAKGQTSAPAPAPSSRVDFREMEEGSGSGATPVQVSFVSGAICPQCKGYHSENPENHKDNLLY